MPELPSGTVTFLFTDIEGSTALWERDRTVMQGAVARHLKTLRDTVVAHGGVLFKVIGDATQFAFATAPDAVASATEAAGATIAHTPATGIRTQKYVPRIRLLPDGASNPRC